MILSRGVIMVLAGCLAGGLAAQDRATKVRSDRDRVQQERYWIYNDLPAGWELARLTGKPLLVVFRCIPCEHCAQLDERVVEKDPLVQSLLDKFVCVRIVHANGMDLSLFQFDYDQSWSAFFLNADRTIYGRYGTRSHQTESDEDVSLEGFAKALQGALDLHRQFPQIKDQLTAKRGAPSAVKVPEDFPSLKGKYGAKLDYEGKVVQSCIHCHQVGEALRLEHRAAGKPIPDPVLFPYPHPKSVGLIMDPREKARVTSVTAGSPAAAAGFLPGDELLSMQGQPLLSIADIQWVLHHVGDAGQLAVEALRGGQPVSLRLNLERGWRRRGDISWRATTWDLRRMATGGMVFEELPDADRGPLELSESSLALRIKHVGQYGAHAAGKNAGFRPGDVLVEADGHREKMTESELVMHLLGTRRAGDKVDLTVLRGGQRITLKLPMQ